jgi:hypothetical protein
VRIYERQVGDFGGFLPQRNALRGLAFVLAKEILKFPERGRDMGLGPIKWLIWRKKTKNLNVTAPYMSIKGCSELFPVLNPANRGVFYWPLSRRKNF